MTRAIVCPYCDDGIREYSVGLEVRVEACPWCSGRGHMDDRRAEVRDRPAFPAVTWILAIALVATVAYLIAVLAAAPRSAPDPTAPQPGASTGDVVSDGALVAQVQASTSGPEPSGAPRDGLVATAPAPQTLDPRVGREGDIAHSGSRTPYVAIPLGPGIWIRVCGLADCIEVTSTDAGPARSMLLAGRIMDLDMGRWERVCGMPARFGLCPGSWVRVTGSQTPRVTLPPTDVAP